MTNDSQLLEPLRLPLPDFRDWWSGHGVCFICPNVLLSRRRQRQRLQNFPHNFRPRVFKCVCDLIAVAIFWDYNSPIILCGTSSWLPGSKLKKKKAQGWERTIPSGSGRANKDEWRVVLIYGIFIFHVIFHFALVDVPRFSLSFPGEQSIVGHFFVFSGCEMEICAALFFRSPHQEMGEKGQWDLGGNFKYY